VIIKLHERTIQVNDLRSYAKFSLWWKMFHLAWMEPPRETMPVLRWMVMGT